MHKQAPVEARQNFVSRVAGHQSYSLRGSQNKTFSHLITTLR